MARPTPIRNKIKRVNIRRLKSEAKKAKQKLELYLNNYKKKLNEAFIEQIETLITQINKALEENNEQQLEISPQKVEKMIQKINMILAIKKIEIFLKNYKDTLNQNLIIQIELLKMQINSTLEEESIAQNEGLANKVEQILKRILKADPIIKRIDACLKQFSNTLKIDITEKLQNLKQQICDELQSSDDEQFNNLITQAETLIRNINGIQTKKYIINRVFRRYEKLLSEETIKKLQILLQLLDIVLEENNEQKLEDVTNIAREISQRIEEEDATSNPNKEKLETDINKLFSQIEKQINLSDFDLQDKKNINNPDDPDEPTSKGAGFSWKVESSKLVQDDPLNLLILKILYEYNFPQEEEGTINFAILLRKIVLFLQQAQNDQTKRSKKEELKQQLLKTDSLFYLENVPERKYGEKTAEFHGKIAIAADYARRTSKKRNQNHFNQTEYLKYAYLIAETIYLELRRKKIAIEPLSINIKRFKEKVNSSTTKVPKKVKKRTLNKIMY